MLTALRLLTGRRPALLLLILAAALLARAIVPGGWMTVAGPEGLRVMVCAGTAADQQIAEATFRAALAGSAMEHQGQAGDGDPADQPCAFSGLALAALDTPPPLLIAAPAPEQIVAASRAEVAIGRGLAAPPPPSTGPPLLS